MKNIILLHGWGGSKSSLEKLKTELLNKNPELKLIVPDFPGFGAEPAPSLAWGVDDYANWVLELAKKENIDKFYVFGHSFGGRVGIKLAANHPEKIEGLILCAAAGIKPRKTLKQTIFLILAKSGKVIFSLPLIKSLAGISRKGLYFLTGERDYYRTNGIMREIFKKVTAEDLSPFLNKIKTPTLLIWGKNDKITPLADALLMQSKIPNSALKVLNDTGHYLHKERAEEVAKFVKDFVEHH